jgi:predicted ArsR family transcriptional regulator
LRFVRPLSDEEVRKLEYTQRNEVGRVSQRAHMILLSNRRFCVVRISRIFGTRQATIRRWIERFEQDGIDCLCDRSRSGRPPKVAAAATSPASTRLGESTSSSITTASIRPDS